MTGDRALRVLHVSASDTQGGAALAAFRLHRALGDVGVDSRMAVGTKASTDASIVTWSAPGSRFQRLARRLEEMRLRRQFATYRETVSPECELFSFERGQRFDSRFFAPDLDVVNLHWLGSRLDEATILHATSCRVVWTLHDMNPFTGGCHYDSGCGRFREGCGRCPLLRSARTSDLSRRVFERKSRVRNNVQADALHVVCLNEWMRRTVATSPLLSRFATSVIPNGIDLSRYSPRDRREARRLLGIDTEHFVVLAACESLANPRKGIPFLVKAVESWPERRPVHLLTFGRSRLPYGSLTTATTQLGFLDHPTLQAMVYSAADVYVLPSTQDNQPNTILEAMACGVAVVASDVGGIPEIVSHGRTGLLVPPGDSSGLLRALVQLSTDGSSCREMGRRGRDRVESEFGLGLQASRYRRLYEGVARR